MWIKDKYFKRIGTRDWIFTGETGLFTREGNPEWITLKIASDITIKRFVKIKGDANPFDPVWEHLF